MTLSTLWDKKNKPFFAKRVGERHGSKSGVYYIEFKASDGRFVVRKYDYKTKLFRKECDQQLIKGNVDNWFIFKRTKYKKIKPPCWMQGLYVKLSIKEK